MFRKTIMGLGLLSLYLVFPLLLSADFLILGPSDFQSQVNDPTEADYSVNVTQISPGTGDTNRNYSAHVHLPEGVRIREVTLYYRDDSAGNIRLAFYKHRMYDHYNVLSFDHYTSGAASFDRVDVIPGSAITTKLIQNQSNRYVFIINFTSVGPNLKVYGVKIKYY